MQHSKRIPLILFITAAAITGPSCQKPAPVSVPAPSMTYMQFNNRIVQFGTPPLVIDINGDQVTDFVFGVTLVGDPIRKEDRREYRVSSGVDTEVPVNAQEQLRRLNAGDTISAGAYPDYNWWPVTSSVLMQRVENMAGTIRWEGWWMGAQKKYLPFRLHHANDWYNGWVELTAGPAMGCVVVHRLAICKTPGIAVQAGK